MWGISKMMVTFRYIILSDKKKNVIIVINIQHWKLEVKNYQNVNYCLQSL